MQVSHRFLSDRLEQSGRAENNNLTGFHTSLLEVLPHAAAYVAQDGSVLVHNKQMKALCAAKGVFPVPVSLPSLLSETSWRRCEAVLSAAFSGVPAQASGAIVLQSGETFCHHMICTSFVSLSGERQAVLVQFDLEEHGQDEIVTLPEPARNEIRSAKSARDLDLLEHFPDDVLVFDGSESLDEMAGKLLKLINSDYEMDLLAEALENLEGELPQTFYIPENRSFQAAGYVTDRQMCEVRLVPIPSSVKSKPGMGASMAVIRRNVDCPQETAENRRLAYLDPLTGLENRRAFTKALKRELTRLAAEDEIGLAVLYIDLDEFKKVNDLGGHDAGDDMLQRVAACLRLTLGEFGTAARIGGDEFAGMVPVVNEEAALDIAEEILAGFDRIRLEVGDRVFTIGGSIGVAFLDSNVKLREGDAAALLGLADRACLRGKRFGGRSVQVHSVQPQDCERAGGELADLPEPGSFRGNELTLYAMPIVCLKRNRACGSEILLRLQGDRARGLSSRAWISAAERSGFIAQVDAWTLDKVLDAAERNPDRTILTMNVSAESARDPIFRDGLYHRLSVNPLLASKLCLEIAEKDFLREPASVQAFFKFVNELGCQTAIDDFAGHWPVLSRLTNLRVEWLKLESSLTQQVVEEPAKAAILNGLVRAAHELGIKVIAKHVETAEEASLLRELDIEAAQGYFFGRPEPWPGG
ncbi:putative bifunctional diguanylate cyclase/phosphodiesterase [Roseibium aggregatum]|uniref:putative bifunctional diguanylate cyclase/phosphodiesterase n=1 Tax=Roseibium aggregatum TaxID=187304 RepID=UPI0025ABC362|nr:EAL domain-containing protein [Roseibium aggregatum]WJS02699.1 EAL domain-containing protein [Roseibium aggregatum]